MAAGWRWRSERRCCWYWSCGTTPRTDAAEDWSACACAASPRRGRGLGEPPILELAAVSGVYSGHPDQFSHRTWCRTSSSNSVFLVARRRGVRVAQISARLQSPVGRRGGPLPRAALGPRRLGWVMVVCGGRAGFAHPAWPQAGGGRVCVLYGARRRLERRVPRRSRALAPRGASAYLTGEPVLHFRRGADRPAALGAIASVTGSYGRRIRRHGGPAPLVVVPMLARRGP